MNTAYFILKRGAEVIEETLLEKEDDTPYNENEE